MSIEVLVPLSISGIWYPVERDNPLESGSIGLTLTLEPYVIAEIKKGNGIFLNDVEINFPNYNILRQK
ncbi:GHMP kinase, partial [Sulfolobus sp. E1]